jgi:transcriptional regulator with XRE-family HTH domain
MDNRAAVREFLTSRRARITPQQAGLPDIGPRRVPGLRRVEVAALAGVSIEYYSKLERGALAGVSPQVLDSISRALQLDDAERAHLFHLADAAAGTAALIRPTRRTAKRWTSRPSLQWTLDAITSPAIVVNARQDLLATNLLGRAMHTDLYTDLDTPPNFARFIFLDDNAHQFYPDWDTAADINVRSCAPAPGATPTTRPSTTSSASCPPAAQSSSAGGAATTCAPTAPAPNGSTTTSSASSPWPTRPWPSTPNPGCR